MHIAQSVHEARLRAAGCDASLFVRDKQPTVSLSDGMEHTAIYCDNHLILGNDPNDLNVLESKSRVDLNSNGLPTHEHIELCIEGVFCWINS